MISPCDSRFRRASMMDDVLSITLWESLDGSDDGGGWYFIPMFDSPGLSPRMRQLDVVKTKGL